MSPSSTRTPSGPRGFRRALITGLTLVVALFGLLLVGPTAASAAPPASFVSDGCTLVPEAPSGVSFHAACVDHDWCYATHASSRSGCDAAFYTELKQACAAAYSAGVGLKVYTSCRAWAAVYYAGVRVFGGYFYNSSSALTRIQTPMQA